MFASVGDIIVDCIINSAIESSFGNSTLSIPYEKFQSIYDATILESKIVVIYLTDINTEQVLFSGVRVPQ